MAEKRDYQNSQYVQWRRLIYKRDKYKCLECGSKDSIQAHHIKTWEGHPELRFDVNNGVSLCKKCHQKIWGNEESYEQRCHQLLHKESVLEVNFLLRQMRKQEEDVDE